MKTLTATLLLLAGAASAQTTIRLPLNVINTARPHQYHQVGTHQSTDLSRFRGMPTDLTEKVLRTASTLRGQTTYESFLRGDIDQTTWEKTKRELGTDTLKLSRTPLRHQINTLVGTNAAGQQVIIVDANNNRDFSDDRAFTYPMTLPGVPKTASGYYDDNLHALLDTLPAVTVQIEATEDQRIIRRTVSFKPVPYNTGWTYPDPEQNRFHLTLLAHEYRQATLTVSGKPVEIFVTTVPGLAYNTRATTIDVREAGQPVNKLLSQGPFQPGYTFLVADHVLEIKALSTQGDLLTLVDKGVVTPTR